LPQFLVTVFFRFMNGFEDFKRFLPQYLSPQSQKELYDGLKQFPPIFDQSMFSARLMDEADVFQGDGLRAMPVINLPDTTVVEGPVLVLSNTCDTSLENTRVKAPSISYCPIVKLSNLEKEYKAAGMTENAVKNVVESIRKQKTTRFFFLPRFGGLPEDCVALLDHAVSCSMSWLSDSTIADRRLFSLSNLGFYVFLVKLGIHFTRVMEEVDRG
jgi:hypothetical protein